MAKSPRRRIFFLGGGAHTIPSYRALLNELSEQYDVTVFFEFRLEIKHPIRYDVRILPIRIKYQRLRNVVFGIMILKNILFQRPHLIHAHSTFPSGYWGLIFSKLFRIPIIVSLDAAEASAVPDLSFGDLIYTKRTRINKWIIKKADVVFVLTDFIRNQVEKNLNIDRQVKIIPRGVDIDKFKYVERDIESPYKFLSVGYLHPVKDHEMMLKAFSIISKKVPCSLTHIGEDYSNGKIQKMVNELDLTEKVKFEGFVPNDLLPQYYSKSDILLHTSRFESQAVVVNEALASGLLVFGTNVGLLADLSEICCKTVAPGDFKGLASIVLDLLAKPELINQLRQSGYEWSVNHDLAWTVSQHVEIYEGLLRKSAR